MICAWTLDPYAECGFLAQTLSNHSIHSTMGLHWLEFPSVLLSSYSYSSEQGLDDLRSFSLPQCSRFACLLRSAKFKLRYGDWSVFLVPFGVCICCETVAQQCEGLENHVMVLTADSVSELGRDAVQFLRGMF